MTAKAKHATPAPSYSAPVVLFGIDSRGKPKGARFGKEHASLAIKAASQLQLKVLASDDPKVSEIAARLPVGRVHGNGRTFVPFIRQDLYDKLVAAARMETPSQQVRRQADPRVPQDQRPAALRLTCRGIGKRSESAISSSLRKALWTVGTMQLSLKPLTTC
jgi:hypothetical protein